MQSNVYDDETDFDASGFIKHTKNLEIWRTKHSLN